MRYLPHTPRDRQELLAAVGVGSIDELFADIPQQVRLGRRMELPEPLSEPELWRHLQQLGSRCTATDELTCFAGGGAYDHHIPSVVDHILLRGDWYTAYTPYQAEVSQGVLQSIYEYQSLICELTGMPVANASHYDGATAMTEAAIIAAMVRRSSKIAVSLTVHPEYRQTLATYARGQDMEIIEIPARDGVTDTAAAAAAMAGDVACLVVQHPNFFGLLEPVEELGEAAHARKGLYVTVVDPVSLGILKPPGEYGADFVVGEGQSLGVPLSFGGPYLGFFASSERLLRKMPGRLSGATVDAEGRRGFVLALQTREQHIRRDKATSNICSNEALCALAATVYLSLLGREGIAELARLCLQKAHYLHERVGRLERFRPAFDGPFFREFCIVGDLPADRVVSQLAEQGILVGPGLGRFGMPDHLLLAVTEKRTREEIDHLVGRLEGLL